MSERSPDEVRSAVRDHYGNVARTKGAVGCAPSCCSPTTGASLGLGYSESDLASVPEGADMGLGCGNPQAIASMRAGETVLDLGSGGGFDAFLASRQVGPTGRVIGVDMTPEMIAKARANATKLGASNVEFRLGEIEHLPVDPGTIDVILSNCVVNLSPDKGAVFREAHRVLKPGGRLAISDVVLMKDLPPAMNEEILALVGCVSGAARVDTLETLLREAGFVDVRVMPRPESRAFIREWLPGSGVEDHVASATIEARKAAVVAAPCCGPSGCGEKTT
jgi:arsenite methyltransferase